MAAASGQVTSAVEKSEQWGELRATLESEPYNFRFFQAVRLLQRMFPGADVVGRYVPPSSEVVRFGVRPSLIFPASEIHSLKLAGSLPAHMTVNFMGLIGAQGVLPLFYTEFILDRLKKGDQAPAAFLDMFHHRIISLFYQAWEKHHLAVTYERGETDQISRCLMDLIGIGTAGLQKRLEPAGIHDDALLHYSGLLSQQPASAQSLEQIIADYFEVPVAIEQFCGVWRKLDRCSQTCLDEGSSWHEGLGIGAVVGDEIWDQQSVVRIRIGPLPLKRYREFLPNGKAYKPLQALVRFHAGPELEFEVQLVLKRKRTPRLRLGGEGTTAPQLGWVSWIQTVPIRRDPAEAILKL